jgi:hypothetical protein
MEHFTWSTASSRLAATFAGLGFIVSSRQTEMVERNSRLSIRYFISQSSQWRQLDRDVLRNDFETGALAQADPMHPFLQGWRGIGCYLMLCRRQERGVRLRLKEVVPGKAWEYEEGEEDPRLTLSKQVHSLRDLPLCGALGTVGIPVVDSDGEPGRRRYFVPTVGLKSLNGIDLPEWRTAFLIRRKEPGKLDLQIEAEDPEHPLSYAYQGAYAYAKLAAHIKRLERYMILKAPRSNRRVIIHEHASDHALDQVGRFFRA